MQALLSDFMGGGESGSAKDKDDAGIGGMIGDVLGGRH